jgi:hypothetical protein
MGVNDALTAQGMATFHKRSVTPVVKGIGHINALLRRIIKGKKVVYGSYGDGIDWYVEKLDETAEWNSGQLGTRTFEEKDPVAKATLEMCFVDRTYGIGEKSIKTNRAAGIAKIYSIQKKNAEVAQSALYRAIVDALYSSSDGAVANGPAGLREICSDPLETTSTVAVTANTTYAGLYNSGSAAISAYAKNKASFQSKYWAPELISVHEVPGAASSPKWSTDCLIDLAFMSIAMGRTKDISGTGKIVKPDLALMNIDPFQAVWAKMLTDRSSAGPINLSDTDFDSVGIQNVVVGPITVVFDENVPDDANTTALEVVYVVDSKAFKVHTCNTKSEGLVEGQWKGNTDPNITGGVGVYKSNMAICIDSPVCAGAIVGCND